MLRLFRTIRDDTKALIADLRTLYHRLSTRWQWMRLRSRRRLDEASADLENVRRSAGARTRMCSWCRALIPIGARTCPECGESPGRSIPTGLSRLLESMVPGFVSVTSVLLTLNIGFYGLSYMVDARLAGGGLPEPLRDASWVVTLIAMGGEVPALTYDGEIWRLLTYVFLHGGLLHLMLNSWSLLTVGPLLEELYGSSRFFLIYVMTGIGGGAVSAWWNQGSWRPAVGASGALFGLIGVAAVWGWRRGGRVGEAIRAQMVQWALYGLAMGLLLRFMVDNAAHIGGLLTGVLLGLIVSDADAARTKGRRFWDAVALSWALVTLVSFAMVGLRFEHTLQLTVQLLGG